jgi:surfactin synthase thioesterase subunit
MRSVVFLPFAGGGASVFRSWSERAAGRFTVLAVQLPGREERFVEEPLTQVADAADDALEQIRRSVPEGEQVAVFGHSLGAVLAFEVAKRLESDGRYDLVKVFASGSPGPWNGRDERTSGLGDDAFLAQVRRFAGYEHPALVMAEMRDLLLPMLRADVRMHEDYVPADHSMLSVPVVALRGMEDELVSADQAAQWAGATTGAFTYRGMEGAHMYLVDAAQAAADLIGDELGCAVYR